MYNLEVVYPTDSLDSALDVKIRATAQGFESGSGSGMGERDIWFEYPTKANAEAALDRICALDKRIEGHYWYIANRDDKGRFCK